MIRLTPGTLLVVWLAAGASLAAVTLSACQSSTEIVDVIKNNASATGTGATGSSTGAAGDTSVPVTGSAGSTGAGGSITGAGTAGSTPVTGAGGGAAGGSATGAPARSARRARPAPG